MPIHQTYSVLIRFFKLEAAGGIVLFAAALLAMLAANDVNLAQWYEHFLHAPVGIILGERQYQFSMSHFINDGLMSIFFLLVGLEIKRELVKGELSTPSQALLPALAAAGGMIGPALIYTGFNWGDESTLNGWAIPTATDIAFSLGVLSLLGKRAPFSLKIFLLAIAVIDDLGAILIIALFYSGDLALTPLLLSFITLLAMFTLNRNHITARFPYMILFFILWVCVLQSGIHATIAGVAAAMVIPLDSPEGEESLLEKLEHDLHTAVAFFILPIFAFANAGVNFSGLSFSDLANPLPLGIIVGLIIGKAIGITGATWLTVKSGIAQLPANCSWSAVGSLSLLCGIGFTVSLFIGNLAFPDGQSELINLVKLGVLTGSIIAGVCGYSMLRFFALKK